MMSKKTYYRHRKFDDAGKFFPKNRILLPQADFLELFAGGKIVYNIVTAATNFRMNFGAAGKFFTS
jgi:hypothetical protein